MEVRRGHLIGSPLRLPPFHEEAVGQAPKHAENPDALVALDPATVIIVRDVQALMESAFDSPAGSIKLEPLRGVEPLGRRAGDQSHLLVFAPGGLAQQPRRLAREGKAHVLGFNGGGLDAAIFDAALVFFRGARLRRGGLLQGGKAPRERRLSFQCWLSMWVDYS